MNDDLPDERSGFSRSDAAPNPAALDAALGAAGTDSNDAREFLREQKRLTALQAKILHEEHALELSHLRWRRFNDQMKGTLQIILAVLGVSLVVAIAAAVWSASQADGIVVDSFSVPPSLAQTGLTGDVIAADVTNRLAQMRRYVDARSIGTTSEIRSNSKDDVQIEIPETGISLSALWHDLRDWLGNERRVTGSVREAGAGRIALTVALAGDDPVTVAGNADSPDAIEQGAAEGLFSQMAPGSYVAYLFQKGRYAEALAAGRQATDEPPAVHFGMLAMVVPYATGDLEKAEAYDRLAIALAPGVQIMRIDLGSYEHVLGHSEQELRIERSIVPLREADQSLTGETHAAFERLRNTGLRHVALLTGDYGDPAIVACFGTCTAGEGFALRAMVAGLEHDVQEGARLLAFARAAGDADDQDYLLAAWLVAVARADWSGAKTAATQFQHAIAAYATGLPVRYARIMNATQAIPFLGVAEAHLGAFGAAWAAIEATPRDCYPCVRSRGDIEAIARNWGAAEYWFQDAVRQAPSIPFGYTDWGEMLLHKGDYDGAVAKFTIAHEKGPHFADPLEMWGEALMQENRSDLALAKFEEADKYAPNWGRLHLEWGKALMYLGRRAEAQHQFAIASHLDLGAADTASLARWRAKHV